MKWTLKISHLRLSVLVKRTSQPTAVLSKRCFTAMASLPCLEIGKSNSKTSILSTSAARVANRIDLLGAVDFPKAGQISAYPRWAWKYTAFQHQQIVENARKSTSSWLLYLTNDQQLQPLKTRRSMLTLKDADTRMSKGAVLSKKNQICLVCALLMPFLWRPHAFTSIKRFWIIEVPGHCAILRIAQPLANMLDTSWGYESRDLPLEHTGSWG